MSDVKESETADTLPMRLTLPSGTVIENFEMNLRRTVSQEVARICNQENELTPPSDLALVLVTDEGVATVMKDSDMIVTYMEHLISSHLRLKLKSQATDKCDSSPQPDFLNYQLKK